MIENNLKLEIDGKIILNNISFKINLNKKVGLVGKIFGRERGDN